MRRRATRASLQARTPLFRQLRQYLQIIHYSKTNNLPLHESDELLRSVRSSRREFLRQAGGIALLGSFPSQFVFAASTPQKTPDIVIIGAGIAGLNAAHHLKKAKIKASIYEASQRTGGRILTRKNVLGPGLTTEIGGEFIDSSHEDMLNLAKEFNLELIDRHSDPLPPTFFFQGKHYTQAQVLEALLPVLTAVKAADYENEANEEKLDKLSLAQYLDKLGASGWSRSLIEAAYISEFGAEPDELAALAFIDLFVNNSDDRIDMFGTSDERYKVKGGNGQICDALAERVKEHIHFGHRLIAIREKNNKLVAVFDIDKERSVEVKADILLVTIPFSVLRHVDIKIPLPSLKKKAINELGYGDNAKICLGTNSRPWREQGFNGETFSDTSWQLCWDNSQLQHTDQGGITIYLGGKKSRDSLRQPIKNYRDDLVRCFPGIEKQFNGAIDRFYWPEHPLARGSYAFYKPGQWTSFSGEEITPVGNLFFAGEHCSENSQGYMNGGAETGRVVAESILEKIKHHA